MMCNVFGVFPVTASVIARLLYRKELTPTRPHTQIDMQIYHAHGMQQKRCLLRHIAVP